MRNASTLILSAFDLAAKYPRLIQNRALPALAAKRVARFTVALGRTRVREDSRAETQEIGKIYEGISLM